MKLIELLLGNFLNFTTRYSISSGILVEELILNYKTTLLLNEKFFNKKCRILMCETNSEKILNPIFYGSDLAYIGT